MAAVTTQYWLRFYLFCLRFADYGCILEILSLELLPDGRSYVDTVGGSRFRVLKRGHRDGYHTADIEYLDDLKVRDMKFNIKSDRDPWKYQRNLTVRLCFSQVNGSELELLHHLHDSVYQQTQEWYQRLGSRIREQINKQYGAMPDKEEDIQVWNRKFCTLTCCCVSALWLWYVMIMVCFCPLYWFESVLQASSNGPAWCWWLLSVLQLDPAYQTNVLSLTSLKDRLGHLRLVLEYFSQR